MVHGNMAEYSMLKDLKKKSKNSDKLILIVQNSYIFLNSEHRMRAGLAEINGT